MLTKICTLTLPGGQIITGKVTTASPDAEPPVEYVGETTLLPRLHSTASPAFLHVFFRNVALDIGAQFSSQESGEYEIWAE